MNYLVASCRDIKIEISLFLYKSIGVLNSFIPIRCAVGIRSTYKFQCVSLLKFESHE
jgi:hypothetical protein